MDEFDIAGDDDGETGWDVGFEVGRRRRGRAPAGMARQPMARGPTLAVGPYGTPVHAAEPKAARALYQTFGLGTASTAGAGSSQLAQVFQESFRPERLVLQESVAGNSVVNAITIGIRPQSANLASMPVSAFGSGAFETRVQFDTGQPGTTFAVQFTNLAAGAVSGMAFGTVIKAA
jgi:hypothetical protein